MTEIGDFWRKLITQSIPYSKMILFSGVGRISAPGSQQMSEIVFVPAPWLWILPFGR